MLHFIQYVDIVLPSVTRNSVVQEDATRSYILPTAGESKSIGSLVPAPFRLEGSSGRLVTAALMTQYRHHRFRLELQAKEAAPPYRVTRTSVHVSGAKLKTLQEIHGRL